jgi:hypothetical protein
MKRPITSGQLTKAVADAIDGATKSVDIFCNAYVDFAGPISGLELKAVLSSIPLTIPVRCILGIAVDEEDAPSSYLEKSAQVVSEALSIATSRRGMEIRTPDWWTGAHFILIDRTIALWASMPIFGIFHNEWDIYLTDEKKALDFARRPFEMFEFPWRVILHSEPAERLLTSDDLISVSHVDWDAINRDLRTSNVALYSMSPRKFEEFIAELLFRNGLEVRLTPPSKDGGRDILASSHSVSGDLLYLVECKRYRIDRPVGVSIVRGLYGVVEQENATAGLLFTSSRFTKGAMEFQRLVRHRLTLHDYESIISWVLSTLNPNQTLKSPADSSLIDLG